MSMPLVDPPNFFDPNLLCPSGCLGSSKIHEIDSRYYYNQYCNASEDNKIFRIIGSFESTLYCVVEMNICQILQKIPVDIAFFEKLFDSWYPGTSELRVLHI